MPIKYNKRLAVALEQVGEVHASHKVPWFLVLVDGVKVWIESDVMLLADSNKLIESCREKVREGVADVAFGVIYVPPDPFGESGIEYVAITDRSEGRWVAGSVQMLVESILLLAYRVKSSDVLNKAIEKLGKVLKEAGGMLFVPNEA